MVIVEIGDRVMPVALNIAVLAVEAVQEVVRFAVRGPGFMAGGDGSASLVDEAGVGGAEAA